MRASTGRHHLSSRMTVSFRRTSLAGAMLTFTPSASRCALRKLVQRAPGAVQECPRVVDLLAVADDPEVDAVLVADHGDVQADAVDDHRDRVVGEQLGTRAVERAARAGDVGDDEVQRRAGAAEDVDRVARGERGNGGGGGSGRGGPGGRPPRTGGGPWA